MAPQRNFEIAFKMFDLNGDGEVDMEEFEQKLWLQLHSVFEEQGIFILLQKQKRYAKNHMAELHWRHEGDKKNPSQITNDREERRRPREWLAGTTLSKCVACKQGQERAAICQ
ncbi:UNVERIFIED_CONTAM: hypothetical protein K2H54_028391 [Gekko kuhli]